LNKYHSHTIACCHSRVIGSDRRRQMYMIKDVISAKTEISNSFLNQNKTFNPLIFQLIHTLVSFLTPLTTSGEIDKYINIMIYY